MTYDTRNIEKALGEIVDIIDDIIMRDHTSKMPLDESPEWDGWYEAEYAKVWRALFPHIPLPNANIDSKVAELSKMVIESTEGFNMVDSTDIIAGLIANLSQHLADYVS